METTNFLLGKFFLQVICILIKGRLDLAIPEYKAKDRTRLSSVKQRNFLTHLVYLLSFLSMESMVANKEIKKGCLAMSEFHTNQHS